MKTFAPAAVVAAVLALAACGSGDNTDAAPSAPTTQAPTPAAPPAASQPVTDWQLPQGYDAWANTQHAELGSAWSTKLMLDTAVEKQDARNIGYVAGMLTHKFDSLFWSLTADRVAAATAQGHEALDALDACAEATGDLSVAIEGGPAGALGSAAAAMDECGAKLQASQVFAF